MTMVVGKCGWLARTCGLKDADTGQFPTWATHYFTVMSHRSAHWKSSNKRIRHSLKPQHSDCRPRLPFAQCGLKTDLDPHENRCFGFGSVPPKSAVSVSVSKPTQAYTCSVRSMAVDDSSTVVCLLLFMKLCLYCALFLACQERKWGGTSASRDENGQIDV